MLVGIGRGNWGGGVGRGWGESLQWSKCWETNGGTCMERLCVCVCVCVCLGVVG